MSLRGADSPPVADAAPADSLQDLQRRLGKAEADRDSWRLSGDQERYLAAYGLVEALELQLAARLRERHA